jgi:hypothetical protein
MSRVQCLASVAGAFCAALLATGPTLAKPLPIASADEIETMAGQPAYRQCVWADGYRLCRTFYGDDASAAAGSVPNPGSYVAPGIYLDNSGIEGAADH